MQILIVGQGGREHALAWKAAQSPMVTQVYVAPGNAGTASEHKIKNIAIDENDIPTLVHFARDQKIDMTIIGPEQPLMNGISDQFTAHQLRCLGPCQKAAYLEGSKIMAKAFMRRHQIPTAPHHSFDQLSPAIQHLQNASPPYVIKADGLAAGKGVVVTHSQEEAIQAATRMLAQRQFGDAGRQIVVEDYLDGEELSAIVLVDGEHFCPLAFSQDHKARDEHDQGPNTGGMGAYSPVSHIAHDVLEHIGTHIIRPTIAGLIADQIDYRGFLYIGLMIDAHGKARVLEYNCRLGDPEAQPILMRLRSDFIELCAATFDQSLQKISLEWDTQSALGVVWAAQGYPGDYERGHTIVLPTDYAEYEKIFLAGATLDKGTIISNGGRVLCATALGDNIAIAQQRAYALGDKIQFNRAYYRRDIGWRALQAPT